MHEDEVRVFGYCAECGYRITDNIEDYFCDEDGNLLCSFECVLEHCSITHMEV